MYFLIVYLCAYFFTHNNSVDVHWILKAKGVSSYIVIHTECCSCKVAGFKLAVEYFFICYFAVFFRTGVKLGIGRIYTIDNGKDSTLTPKSHGLG